VEPSTGPESQILEQMEPRVPE
ncbi:hypothetical protein AVEN_219799-1, partial [Araneus ventricosus]